MGTHRMLTINPVHITLDTCIWAFKACRQCPVDSAHRGATSDYEHQGVCPILGGIWVILQRLGREVDHPYMGVF